MKDSFDRFYKKFYLEKTCLVKLNIGPSLDYIRMNEWNVIEIHRRIIRKQMKLIQLQNESYWDFHRLEPRLEKIITKYNETLTSNNGDQPISLAKVDIDKFQDLTDRFKIQAVPTGQWGWRIEKKTRNCLSFLFSCCNKKWQRNRPFYGFDRWRSNWNIARSFESLNLSIIKIVLEQ